MNRVTLRIVSNIAIGYWNVNASDWPPITANLNRSRPTARIRTGEARTLVKSLQVDRIVGVGVHLAVCCGAHPCLPICDERHHASMHHGPRRTQ